MTKISTSEFIESTEFIASCPKRHALHYAWAHIDWGKYQTRCNNAKYKHGDIVEFVHPVTGKSEKGVFRLLEKDLYVEGFVKKSLPILKQIWQDEPELILR